MPKHHKSDLVVRAAAVVVRAAVVVVVLGHYAGVVRLRIRGLFLAAAGGAGSVVCINNEWMRNIARSNKNR